ncbi:hypothetical protein GQX74_003487 [Glossina fuscipes]|nr:hypothetical protein GQX74_003487 [Glossina fuscipes]
MSRVNKYCCSWLKMNSIAEIWNTQFSIRFGHFVNPLRNVIASPVHFTKDDSKFKTINVDGLLAQMNGDEEFDLPNCTTFISNVIEWTILQLCKGFNTLSTYSKHSKIHESVAAIYVTILRHIRTCDYPKPICLRVTGGDQKELFNKFACVVDRFKQCVQGGHKKWSTVEGKQLYLKLLDELNNFIAFSIHGDTHTFFTAGNNMHKLWRNIDTFCDQYQWNDQSRVLLSLAALNAHSLMNNQIEHFMQRAKAFGLLEQIREQQQQQTVVDLTKNGDDKKHRYIPCILIVDERLDHFYWEEINICQEFTRASSLQSPWRLYYYYRENIEHGYVKVSITDGVCVINPGMLDTEITVDIVTSTLPHDCRQEFTKNEDAYVYIF